MRRRASGSGAEDEEVQPLTPTKNSAKHVGKSKGPPMDITQEVQDELRESKSACRQSIDIGQGYASTNAGPVTDRKQVLQQIPASPHKRNADDMPEYQHKRRAQLRSPWACSPLTLICTALSFVILAVIVQSFLTRQLDPKGCAMSYMRAAFAKFEDFDSEHTRFATKYSLYLYREGGVDEDTRVCHLI